MRLVAMVAGVAAVLAAGIWLVPSEAYVRWSVDRANYCRQASECRVADAGILSPAIVNIDEVAGIEMLGTRYSLFHGSQQYGAMSTQDLSRIACVRNKCVAAQRELR